MAIKRRAKSGIVDFIHPSDEAIDTDEHEGEPRSNLEKYRETWEFDRYCVLRENSAPTIFKVNFAIPYKKQIAIKNASIGGFGKDEETGFKLGNHSFQVVRSILVDIVNPATMPEEEKVVFKRDNRGLVSEETMQELEELGILDDLYSFYLANKSDHNNLKKK